jgi:hypothetical protein
MKNNKGKVFGIIGVCLDGLVVVGGLYIWGVVSLINNVTGSNSFFLFDLLESAMILISYIVLLFAAISLVCLILASFALKKVQSNPKLSGYLFLIAAGISGLVSIYLMIHSIFLCIQSIAYLIAGILCLRDKR